MGELNWSALEQESCKPLEHVTAYEASGLALRLGGLARWCLRREVLDLAHDDDAIPGQVRDAWKTPPQLAAVHGSAWVVFAAGDPEQRRLLRPAFVLPLQWLQNEDHSPLLPRALLDVADAAIDACREDESVACSRWGLRLGPEVGEQSFTDLFVECASGWASLAAGLLVASGGGRPNPKVWASGSWDWRDGIRRVDHLTQKIHLAAELGAERFFVPDSQIQEAEQVAQGIGLHIGRLVSAKRDPRAALDDYLWSLEAPPRLSSDPDNFDRCKAYYLRPRIESRRELDEYYQSQLLPRIVRNLRGQVQTEWPAWNPTRLVTIVSGSPDLVRMSALALGVRHCLLLHTTDADQSRLAHGLKLELERHGVRCLLGPFRVDEHIEQEMNRQLAPFLHGANPSEVVIDLTPGTKQMTVTLARLAIPGNWLVYLSHRFAVDRRAEPGSERFVRWAVGTG